MSRIRHYDTTKK
jgi:hypothetical protein